MATQIGVCCEAEGYGVGKEMWERKVDKVPGYIDMVSKHDQSHFKQRFNFKCCLTQGDTKSIVYSKTQMYHILFLINYL